MSDMSMALENAQLQTERQELRAIVNQLRHLLAGALCAHCGEALGEEEIEQTDDEETCHARCVRDRA